MAVSDAVKELHAELAAELPPTVALANKLLRIAWVIIARGVRYNPALAASA